MKRTNFKDINTNNFLIKRNFDTEGNKFLWPENAFRKVDMATHGASLEDLKAHTLKVCYPSELKISYEKYNDLMAQLEYIPPLYHHFFKSLKQESQPKK